jgi:hypothetical protein
MAAQSSWPQSRVTTYTVYVDKQHSMPNRYAMNQPTFCAWKAVFFICLTRSFWIVYSTVILWGQDFSPCFVRNLIKQEGQSLWLQKQITLHWGTMNNGRKEHHVQMSCVFCLSTRECEVGLSCYCKYFQNKSNKGIYLASFDMKKKCRLTSFFVQIKV